MMESVEEELLEREPEPESPYRAWLQAAALPLLVTAIYAASAHLYLLGTVVFGTFLLVLNYYRRTTPLPYLDMTIALAAFTWWATVIVMGKEFKNAAITIAAIMGGATIACIFFAAVQRESTSLFDVIVVFVCHVIASTITCYAISSSS